MFDSWWHHYRFGNKKSLELLKFKGFFITLLFASTSTYTAQSENLGDCVKILIFAS